MIHVPITGIQALDEQHLQMVRSVELLHDTLSKQRLTKAIIIYEEIVNFAAWHFSEEEKLMKDSQYPKAKEMIAEHEAFINTAKQPFTTIVQGVVVYDKMVGWLEGHLIKDYEFAMFLLNLPEGLAIE